MFRRLRAVLFVSVVLLPGSMLGQTKAGHEAGGALESHSKLLIFMVGPTELESVTSCVSSRRSNQLSYGPARKQKTYYGNHLYDRVHQQGFPQYKPFACLLRIKIERFVILPPPGGLTKQAKYHEFTDLEVSLQYRFPQIIVKTAEIP